MKYNLSEFFPVTEKDLAEFEHNANHPNEFPPEHGFAKLMEAKGAVERLNEYRKAQKKVNSVATLVDTICKAYNQDKNSLQNKFNIDRNDWQSILSNKKNPSIIPAKAYALLAKVFDIPYRTIKEAITGSFTLTCLGTSNSGTVFARSHYAAEQKSTYSGDLKNAFEELLVKGSQKRQQQPNHDMNDFLEEIKKCMT